MHELPYKPPDYGSFEGTSLFPCRPTVKHRSHSLQRKAWLGRVASFRSDVPCVLLWRSRHSCVTAVSALFEPRVRTDRIASGFHPKLRPTSRRSHYCWTTSRVSMPQLTAGVHFLGGRLPCLLSGCLLSGRAHRDGHSVCIRSAATRS